MRIGIMGGTFDPIHIGHLIAAERAREEMELDEVWFLPAHVPPHKPKAPMADSIARREMIEQAIAGHPFFRVCSVEIDKGGTSYSYDTVRHLQQLYVHHSFHYIIGADMILYLPKWYRINELLAIVDFIGLERPGYSLEWDQVPAAMQEKVKMVVMPMIDVSSTEIRARLAAGNSIRYLVTDSVGDYIKEKGLYNGN